MAEAIVAQDCLKLRGQALFVTLEAGPAEIAGVKPEERRLAQRLEQLRHGLLAVTLENMNVRPAGKFFCGALRQRRIEFNGVDFRKMVFMAATISP